MSTNGSRKLSWNDRFFTAHDCEGCGKKIRKAEMHYQVALGTFGDVVLPLGQYLYYHDACLEPYMIIVWLQEGQAVAISQHKNE